MENFVCVILWRKKDLWIVAYIILVINGVYVLLFRREQGGGRCVRECTNKPEQISLLCIKSKMSQTGGVAVFDKSLWYEI